MDDKLRELANSFDSRDYENPDTLQSSVVNPPASIPLSNYTYDPDHWTSEDEFEPKIEDNTLDPSDDALGNWPRRLLHIPTMTSLSWQPGNRYGSHVAPRYNAISYTWGRYDLDIPGAKKQKRYRRVEALHVNRVEWNLPRINPEHFSLGAFEHMIESTANISHELDGNEPVTEFLWLDLACIDQNNGPQKMAEIGRQAAIFHGAERVFVWLTKLSKADLEQCAAKIAWSYANNLEFEGNNGLDLVESSSFVHWLRTTRRTLDHLFVDPWWSSLWTLQEAFLCPHAYLVPLEGVLIPMEVTIHQKFHVYLTISSLCEASIRLAELCENKLDVAIRNIAANEGQSETDIYTPSRSKAGSLSPNKTYLYLRDVQDLLNQRGVIGLASRNPIVLYHVSQFRHCRYDYDRLYGIQQIFGFRLGETRIPQKGVKMPKKIDRFVLEEQLGENLLMNHPVTSQMHAFEEIVEQERGWRPSPSSRVPKLDIKSPISELTFDHKCDLSALGTTRAKQGYFSGRACGFSKLSRAWAAVNDCYCGNQKVRLRSPQQIALDACITSGDIYNALGFTISANTFRLDGSEPILTVIPHQRRSEVVSREQQHRLAWWIDGFLKTYFNASECFIVLLGSFVDYKEHRPDHYHVGLILLSIPGQSYCRRIGFCIWQYQIGASDLSEMNREDWRTLRAEDNSSNWRDERGTFA